MRVSIPTLGRQRAPALEKLPVTTPSSVDDAKERRSLTSWQRFLGFVPKTMHAFGQRAPAIEIKPHVAKMVMLAGCSLAAGCLTGIAILFFTEQHPACPGALPINAEPGEFFR